jgi:hypothetical protein
LNLSEAVELLTVNLSELAIKVNLDGDVQVTEVVLVGGGGDGTSNNLILVSSDNILQVEDSLLPVSVSVIRSSAEVDRLVALAELNIEEGHQGVNKVVALSLDLELRSPGHVSDGDGVHIDGVDLAGVCDEGIGIDSVNERLHISKLLDVAHVESVDVVPEVQLGVLVVTVLNGGNVERSLVGEDDTVLGEPLVTGEDNSVDHGLVEAEVAHPLRDDDINLLDSVGKLDLLNLTVNDGDD